MVYLSWATDSQGSSLQQYRPRLGWDLTLHPKPLNAAYWQERAAKFAQWDYQVVWFLLIMLVALVFKFVNQMGWYRLLIAFGAGWIMCLSWLAALQNPEFYTRYRLSIVLGVRIMMGLSAMSATAGVRDQLYRTLMFSSPVLTVLLKMFLFCNTAQLVVEAVRLQLPVGLQLVVTSFKAVCLMFTEFTSEFVLFTNTSRYLGALEDCTTTWATVVQSGVPIRLSASSQLAGRSSSAMVSLVILYSSTVLLITYMCYLSVWADIRLWLAGKAAEAGNAQEDAPAGVVMISGVAVSQEQLKDMCRSPAAALLLDARGWVGRASQVCLHACVVNVLCLIALLFSQLCMQQILPAVLPQRMLDAYYPLLLQLQDDMCRAEGSLLSSC